PRTARATTTRSPGAASSSPRSRPTALTGSRRSCATTRATGTASPSASWRARPEPGRQPGLRRAQASRQFRTAAGEGGPAGGGLLEVTAGGGGRTGPLPPAAHPAAADLEGHKHAAGPAVHVGVGLVPLVPGDLLLGG